MGAGIFLVSPDVAQEVNSRSAFLMTWVLGGIVALCGALSNGELGGLFPRSGGEYVYLREAYGPLFGFLSGWTSFWIAFPGSIAALAAGFGAAIGTIFNVTRPGFSVAIGVVAALLVMIVSCGVMVSALAATPELAGGTVVSGLNIYGGAGNQSFTIGPSGGSLFGDLGRNVVRGPFEQNWDLYFSKKFAFTEKYSLTFRSEFFNVFNHPNFVITNTAFGAPGFGVYSSTVGNPRILQLALKLNF